MSGWIPQVYYDFLARIVLVSHPDRFLQRAPTECVKHIDSRGVVQQKADKMKNW